MLGVFYPVRVLTAEHFGTALSQCGFAKKIFAAAQVDSFCLGAHARLFIGQRDRRNNHSGNLKRNALLWRGGQGCADLEHGVASIDGD